MVVMRRTTFVVLLLLVVAVSIPAGVGLTQTTRLTVAQVAVDARADFDNDGFGDLAVGAPTESLGTSSQTGAVSVLYGTASGLSGSRSQLITQDTPGVPGAAEPGDRFGAALAAGDFDHDGFSDLAVGASLEDAGTTRDAGAVTVLYGSAQGLTASGSQLFTQVGGAVEQSDQFGSVLAAGDFNNNGVADLAAGAPLEDVGSAVDAGAVSVLYGSGGGLTATGGRSFTQVGAVEQGDRFGSALAVGDFNNNGVADLAAGAPLEDAGTARDAGVVSVLHGSAGGLTATGARTFTQVAGAVEAGDRFGYALAAGDFTNDGFADLAAGAPLEDVGTTRDAGAFSELHGSAGGLITTSGWLHTEGTAPGPQSGDQFGSALAAGDFNPGVADFVDLAVTSPFKFGANGGAVNVFYGRPDRLSAFMDDSFGPAGSRVLSVGHFDGDAPADLVIGGPFTDVAGSADAGMVSVWYGGEVLGLRPVVHFSQNTPGVGGSAEPGDHFGAALAAG
jgi:hypothetical protein